MPNIIKKLICFVSIILLGLSFSFSQNTKAILLDQSTLNCTDTKIDFKVKTVNFSNVTNFQGAIGWDSSTLKIDTLLINSNNSFNLNDTNTSNVQISDNYLNFLWSDTNGRTAPDSILLLTLRFTVKNPIGFKTAIYFIHIDTALYYTLKIDTLNMESRTSVTTDDANFIDGFISFMDTPVIIQKGKILSSNASCSPIGYQWYCNGNLIPNETTGSLTINGSGLYAVSVIYKNGIILKSLPINIGTPPSLVSFDAIRSNNVTNLKWVTDKAVGITYFNLGRKINEDDYKTISTIHAKDSYDQSVFIFNDNEVLSGNISYQLEMVNQDGNKQYSNIVSVNIHKNYEYKVYTNSLRNKMNVEGANICRIDVLDNSGRVLSRKRFSVLNNNIFTNRVIEINNLDKGLYFMKIFNLDGSSKIEKLVVN